MDVVDVFRKGGPAMWPLLALSILSLSVIIERLGFWFGILTKERDTVERVLDAAHDNWSFATQLAKQALDQPIGRFLYAPLQISRPNPEVFRLALEAKAEDELAAMRRGDKVLEAVIALAPLLGLLGTVLGLIRTLGAINLGNLGTSATTGVTSGIGESLICTATGLIVAIFSLTFYRLFQGFLVNQVKVFRRAGSDLELLYLESLAEIDAGDVQRPLPDGKVTSLPDTSTPRRHRRSPSEVEINGPADVGREAPTEGRSPRVEGRRDSPETE